MFRILQAIRSLTGGVIGQKETKEEEIKRLEAQIEDEDDRDGEAERKRLEEQQKQEQNKPTNCFLQSGRITKVEADFVMIDCMYVKKKVLQDCPFRQQLEVGNRVSYLAFRESEDDDVRVTKLERILDEGWEDEKLVPTTIEEENKQLMKELAPTYFNYNQRSEQGTIKAKRNGLLTIETDLREVSVEMDDVELTFVPERGDFVVLECTVQIDESLFDTRGDILQVKKISPIRLLRGSGFVSKADDRGGEITTDDGRYFYCVENCEEAAKPGHGDKVVFEAVENEELNYRCTKVVVEKAATQTVEASRMVVQSQRSSGDFENKRGIKITDDLQVKLSELSETKKIEVIVKNEARHQHKILRTVITGGRQTSQLRLVAPEQKEHYLQTGETVKYCFEVTAKNFGVSREIVQWHFGGQTKIARCFTIVVGDAEVIATHPSNEGTTQARTQAGMHRLAAWNEYKRGGGQITPGQKISKRANFIDIKIGGYHVPDHLKEILLNPSFTKNQIDEELLRTQRCLQESALTPANYKPMYKMFLWMEDIQCEISIKRFNLDRAHFTREEGYLALRIENVGETRPSLIPGDRLVATAPCNNMMEAGCEAVIHKVQKHKILVKFSEHFHEKYNGEDYKVTFQHARGAFQKQHHAINCVTSAMSMDYLFPTKTIIREPWMDVKINDNGNLATTEFDNEFKWYNQSLNDIQKDAIKNIIRSEARPLPYVIFGPPGTGKTMTLIELIHQIVKLSPDSRIMVGTPSNSSANLITERIINANILRPGEFIRIVGLNYVEQELIPEHLAPYCGTVDIASERTVKGEVITTKSGLKQNIQLKHLGRHRITIGTCVTLGTLMQMRFPHNHFTHILVDEAGQCLETETLIPITFINQRCGTVVLAGDPMQLGPIVMSPHAKGFEQSLLVRLMDTPLYKLDKNRFPDTAGYNPRLVTKLRYNYRSLPCILDLYSELFYDSSLIACVPAEESRESAFLDQVYDTLPVESPQSPPYGFIFCGVAGCNKQSPDSPSWFNPAETKSVFNFLLKLYKKGVRSEDIGVITPYQAQVKQIRRILDESGYGGSQGLQKPKIGSVEEFQGQERQVIIISTVRTTKSMLPSDMQHALGFVASPKRLNVAISRAKSLLVIFGHPQLLSADKKWLELIFKAVNAGTYCGCELPDHLSPMGREQTLLNGNHAQNGDGEE